MAKKMRDYTPKRIYWDIFLHLSMYYKGNIRFSDKYQKHIKDHVALLEKSDVAK